MEHTFETPEPAELYVEFGSGALLVTAEEVEQTQVDITGPHAEEFLVEQHGRSISVTAPRRGLLALGDGRHRVALSVPLDSDVATKTGSAEVQLVGRFAGLSLRTGSGDVVVDEAAGPALIETGSGDIEVGSVGELRVKSGSGDIEVGESLGTVVVSTGSGDVLIGRTRAATTVKTGSGDLSVNRAESDVRLSTASGDLAVGCITRGSVVAKNASGDVQIGIPTGTPVWTDIASTTGDVRNRLQPTGAPTEGQDYVEVRATSVSGDVTLVPAESTHR